MNARSATARLLAVLLLAAVSCGAVLAADDLDVCGPLENAYGPFDYRNPRFKQQLKTVEDFHFTPDVAALRRGNTTTRIAGDLGYTLRAFPNHHRALQAMAKLSLREKKPRPTGSRYTMECWFDRAVRFAPDDGTVYMLYGSYLFRLGQRERSLEALQKAEKLGENSGNFHYNMGIIYADLGKYDLALAHAHRAYALGFALPGLKAKLQKAGEWKEPAPKNAR